LTQAKITLREGYRCAPNGAIIQLFEFGDVVTGQVAEWAIADKAASRMFPDLETKPAATLERKRTRKAKT